MPPRGPRSRQQGNPDHDDDVEKAEQPRPIPEILKRFVVETGIRGKPSEHAYDDDHPEVGGELSGRYGDVKVTWAPRMLPVRRVSDPLLAVRPEASGTRRVLARPSAL